MSRLSGQIAIILQDNGVVFGLASQIADASTDQLLVHTPEDTTIVISVHV